MEKAWQAIAGLGGELQDMLVKNETMPLVVKTLLSRVAFHNRLKTLSISFHHSYETLSLRTRIVKLALKEAFPYLTSLIVQEIANEHSV